MWHKIEIKLKIVFHGRWHIGSGLGSSVIDRLTIKDPKRYPYIPGSTLKGVIRHSCEKLAETLGFPVADPHNKTEINAFCSSEKTPYIVDRIFGSRFEGERLFFRNAVMLEKFYPISYFSVITRSRIDRVTGTAKEKALFTTEYLEEASFHTTITGIHPNLTADGDSIPIEYSLLIAALSLCHAIGGDKSTGKGVLDIFIEKIYYNGRKVSLDEALECFCFNAKEFIDYYKLLRGES